MPGLVAGSTLLIALLLGLCCVTSALGADPGRAPDPMEVVEYQHQFNTTADAARERLMTQRRGAGVVTQLELLQGSRFAGVWFDNGVGEFVVPTLPGGNLALLAKSLAEAGLADSYRITHADDSWDDLERAQGEIGDSAIDLFDQGLVFSYLDPRLNSVVFRVSAGADAKQLRRLRALVGASGVSVVIETEAAEHVGIEPLTCRAIFHTCGRPLRAGVGIGTKLNAFRGR